MIAKILDQPTHRSILLAGPDRRRLPQAYEFLLRYRSQESAQIGCVALWEVRGGRLPYQVALERGEDGQLHWHCTCADAVYRGEKVMRHACKHVRGLRDMLPKNREASVSAKARDVADDVPH